MTTPSDEDLINMGTKYFYYKTGSASITAKMDTAEIADLNRQIHELNDRITLAEIQEETANENYINSKENPAKYGLFSAVGLNTTQDWVLAYFFFAYAVFSIFLALTSAKDSVNRFRTGLAMLAILFSIGVMLFIGVMTFG
jgi:hypothetical protein